MDKTFKLMNPVQWHEGLLLYPQHFQQMRREFQQLGLCYLSMGTPHYWGVKHVTVDEGALATGLLRLKTVLAVMPDGSVLECQEGTHQTIEVSLKDYSDILDKGPMMVHLAVMRYQKDAATVTGDFPRYDSVDGPELPDENTGEGGVPIPRLSLKGYLVCGDTVPARYASFPLFKVSARDGGYAFEEFVPPALDSRKSSPTGQYVDRLVKDLRKNTALLSERLQAPMKKDMAAILDQYKKNYDVMVSRLLSLEALAGVEQTHPFDIYREFCVIAGVFCAFSRGYMPPIFEPYNHNNLKATFEPILNYIHQMLDFVKSASSSFAFRLEERVFKLNLKTEWVQGDHLVLGVTVPSGRDINGMAEWIRDAVIASETAAQKALERRVVGGAREVVEQIPELGLTMTKDKLLLRVNVQSEYIKQEEPLHIFNVSDTDGTRPAEVVLYTASE